MDPVVDAPYRLPPPGWYPDQIGQLRWWDGRAWTAAVVERPPDRTWAVLSHLSIFVMPVVAVIVIRLTVGAKDPFLRHHSTEALNEQILFAVLWNVVGVIGLVSAAAAAAAHPHDPPVLFLIAWAVMALGFLAAAATAIRGAVMAHRGVWWRYPVSLRLVRGAVRPDA